MKGINRVNCLKAAVAIPATLIALMLINLLTDFLFSVAFGVNVAHIAYHRAAFTALFALTILFSFLARPNWKSAVSILLLLLVSTLFVYPIFTRPALQGSVKQDLQRTVVGSFDPLRMKSHPPLPTANCPLPS